MDGWMYVGMMGYRPTSAPRGWAEDIYAGTMGVSQRRSAQVPGRKPFRPRRTPRTRRLPPSRMQPELWGPPVRRRFLEESVQRSRSCDT